MGMKREPIFRFHVIVLISIAILYFTGMALYRHYDSRRPYFTEERFNKVKPGWKMEEVLVLLGKPDWENIHPNGSNFQYVNRPKKDPRKFEFMNRRDYVIVFDTAGHVISKDENFSS